MTLPITREALDYTIQNNSVPVFRANKWSSVSLREEDKKVRSFIYGFFCQNNKWYIGKTDQLCSKRVSDHLTNANHPERDRGKGKFYEAMRNTDLKFKFVILYKIQGTESDLETLENRFSDYFDSIHEGYNSKTCGGGGTTAARHAALRAAFDALQQPSSIPAPTILFSPEKTYPVALIKGQVVPLFSPSAKKVEESTYCIRLVEKVEPDENNPKGEIVKGQLTGSSAHAAARLRRHLNQVNRDTDRSKARCYEEIRSSNLENIRVGFYSKDDPKHRETETLIKTHVEATKPECKIWNLTGTGGGSNSTLPPRNRVTTDPKAVGVARVLFARN